MSYFFKGVFYMEASFPVKNYAYSLLWITESPEFPSYVATSKAVCIFSEFPSYAATSKAVCIFLKLWYVSGSGGPNWDPITN